MKTWEMIKELTENPDKEFKQKDNRYWWGEIHELVRNKRFLEQEWEEVKEPVTFMEAVLSGRRIKVSHKLIEDEADLEWMTRRYNGIKPIMKVLSGYINKDIRDIITNGKWYIED